MADHRMGRRAKVALIFFASAAMLSPAACSPGPESGARAAATQSPAALPLSEVGATAAARGATEEAALPAATDTMPPIEPTTTLTQTQAVGENLATETIPSAVPGAIVTPTMALPPASIEPTPTDPAPVGPTPTETSPPTATVEAPPLRPLEINGIPIEDIVGMSAEVQAHVRQIFDQGQRLGRDARAFSKLGDSLIATPQFLTGFDNRPYDLGDYAFLQPVIEHYAGSFERYGVAIHAGLHSWAVFDPIWANKEWCEPNESILDCEFRLNNPSVLLVLLGTNDSGSPDAFDYNLRKVVEFSIENGVIPVLATKADRFEGPENRNNIMLRQIAEDFQIPLWDYDLVAGTLPDRGLQEDQVHLTVFVEHDYTMPEAFQLGHGVHNLTALLVLEALLAATDQAVIDPAAE